MINDGTAGQSTAADTERPFVGEILSLLGDDFGVGGESPETDDDTDAGAPPASGDPAPDGSDPAAQGRSEGEPGDDTGAPPAGTSLEAQPDDAVDPLEGATPLTYTVNGEQRQFDGIRVLGEHGAIIDAAALPKVIQRLSERDNLYERSQAVFERHQALEDSFNRLTRWSLGKDQNGQERVLTGADAIEARNVITARALAANQVLATIFDPDTFARYVEIVGDEQNGYRIVPNQAAIESLQTRAENAAIKAEQAARSRFAEIRATAKPVPELPGRTPAASSDTSVPQLSPESAIASVQTAIRAVGAKGLTADDEKSLAALLPRFIRPTTPAERFQTNEAFIIDEEFGRVVLNHAALRQSASQTAVAASDAATKNATTLAQALRGNRPRNAPAPKTPAQRQPSEAQQRHSTSRKAWELAERLNRGELGTAEQL